MNRRLGLSYIATTLIMATPFMAKANGGGADPYYKVDPIFMAVPDSRSRVGADIRHFGPVGLSLELMHPNFTIRIKDIQKDSPAEATGKLRPGQIIESINGKVLKDEDPRILLGHSISESEAQDGKMNLKIRGQGDVIVQLEPMGEYSPTWPMNCPKSDKIVRKLAEILAKQEKPRWGSILFLLSTGEEKDLKVVKQWMKNPPTQGNNWGRGIEGIALCEYYLRTGDESVLPVIKREAEVLKRNMWNGSWNARGGPARWGYGVLNAAGVHCATFLTMAKLCGVEVDPYTFDTTLTHFYRYAGHGNLGYGAGLPEGGFRDNGKTSGLAMTMAAAALLSPDGEKSNYAKARDVSAMKSFYATSWFRAAHTGGGIGEVWHHCAMNMMRDKRPEQFRSYFDTRRWFMELSRRPNGSIGISGQVFPGGNTTYDQSATESVMSHGTLFALTYTLHRKKLQLFGAPRSQFAKHYPTLPKRPWGNEADDVFLELSPISGSSLNMQDLKNETVERDASLPVLNRIKADSLPYEASSYYLHHPEIGLRIATMRYLCEKDATDIVVPLLKSSDARLRHAGLLALAGMYKGKPIKTQTPEMLAQVEQILLNRDEAWWVTQEALNALYVAGSTQMIARLKDRIAELCKMDSKFMQKAAGGALSRICFEPEYYKDLLPVVLRLADGQLKRSVQKRMITDAGEAGPDVQAFLDPVLKNTFLNIPEVLTFPGGAVSPNGSDFKRSRVAKLMEAALPSGIDYLLKRPKVTSTYIKSGDDKDMYRFSGRFKTDEDLVGIWTLADHNLLEKYPAASYQESIEAWMKSRTKDGQRPFAFKVRKISYGIRLIGNGQVNVIGLLKRTMPSGSFVWSDSMLVGKYSDQAMKMEYLPYKGQTFLIVEDPLKAVGEVTRSDEGGAEEEETLGRNDWEPKRKVFIRVDDGLYKRMIDQATAEKSAHRAKKRRKKSERQHVN